VLLGSSTISPGAYTSALWAADQASAARKRSRQPATGGLLTAGSATPCVELKSGLRSRHMELSRHQPAGPRVVRFLCWSVLIVGPVYLWFSLDLAKEVESAGFLHFEKGLAAFGVAAGMLVAAHFLAGGDIDKNARWLIPCGIVLGFLMIVFWSGHAQRDGLVYDYCAYGAVSEAQLLGCINHADPEEIWKSDTNAARFGREVLSDCLADAGPLCADALEYRLLEEEAAQDRRPY